MTELDKFKRRLIRSVSRLLYQEKKPEEEVWEQLKKETVCDCKLLWDRMRTLTIKKMKRLLVAEDKMDNLAVVARMSFTDWLLSDLVLVHEKINLIGSDKPAGSRIEYKALGELFKLVQHYNIEGKSGDQLAESWAAAALHYNSNGRQCSPMLLQRRWYQLKEQTRSNFYNLWNSYRGNQRLWDTVDQYKPTKLQMDIGQRYPHVITAPFPEWEEQIQMRLVILPTEIEQKMKKNLNTTSCDDESPELVVIEPAIEIIDLRLDSEPEEEGDNCEDSDSNISNHSYPPIHEPSNQDEGANDELNTVNLALVKTEPQEIDGLSNVQIIDATHVPPTADMFQSDVEVKSEQQSNIETPIWDLASDVSKYIESTNNLIDDSAIETDDNQVISSDDLIQEKADEFTRRKLQEKKDIMQPNNSGIIDLDDDSNSKEDNGTVPNNDPVQMSVETTSDDLIMKKADEYIHRNSTVLEKLLPPETSIPVSPEIHEDSINLIKEKADAYFQRKVTQTINTSSYIINLDPTVGENTVVPVTYENMKTKTDQTDDLIQQKTDAYLKKSQIPKIKLETPIEIDEDEDDVVILNEQTQAKVDKISDDLIKEKADEFFRTIETKSKPEIKIYDDVCAIDDIIKQKADDFINKSELKKEEPILESFKVPANLSFVDEGIEFMDEGIEYVDEDEEVITKKDINLESDLKVVKTEINEVSEDGPNFDLKLLMDPVIFIFKLDDMAALKGKPFDSIKNKDIIDQILFESKPLSKISAVDIIKQEIKTESEQLNDDSTSEKYEDDDIASNEHFSSRDSEINSVPRVKLSSDMLQKPRNRSYNPIQLCKNPDFNTRLKWLTVGFFSSQRNCSLLRECKPMTIDLSKAFESKLVDGTLYLKSGDGNEIDRTKAVSEDENKNMNSVLPSAMSIQSLISNTVDNRIRPSPLTKKPPGITSANNVSACTSGAHTSIVEHNSVQHAPTVDLNENSPVIKAERNKVINLRDITEIRRINQHLLTAEVPPLRVNNNGASETTAPIGAMSNTEVTAIERQINDKPKTTSANTNVLVEQINNDFQNSRSELSIIDNRASVKVNIRQPSVATEHPHSVSVDTAQTPSTSKKLPLKPDKSKYKNSPYYRTPVPWNKPITKSTPKDEFLITIDTLNRMINKMNGDDEFCNPSKKNKKPNWVVDTRTNDAVNDKTKETQKEKQKEKQKGKVKEIAKPKSAAPKKYQRQAYKRMYCCWCKEKILKLQTKGRVSKFHQCPLPVCECCCRDELITYVKNKDQEDLNKLCKACPTIKSVVQQQVQLEPITISNPPPLVSTLAATPTPLLRILAAKPKEQRENCGVSTPQQALESNFHDSNTSLLINATSESSQTLENAATKGYINVKARTTSINNTLTEFPVEYRTFESHVVSSSKPNEQITMPSCPEQNILIDGPQTLVTKKNVSKEKKKKDKVLILKSSDVSRRLKETPIYLGKNKILLTTVRIPRMVDNEPAEIQPPKVIPTLPLPQGVHLILLPNGDLSFTCDKNVDLDEEQLAVLPTIMAAVKQQINVTSRQPVQQEAQEVIKLSDDDSDPNDINIPVTERKKQASKNLEDINRSDDAKQSVAIIDSVIVINDSKDINGVVPNVTTTANSAVDTSTDQMEKTPQDNNMNNIDAVASPKAHSSEDVSTGLPDQSKEPEVINDTSENAKVEKVGETATSSRNLLSDLMEMSGISEEDATSTSVAVAPLDIVDVNVVPEDAISGFISQGMLSNINADKASTSAMILADVETNTNIPAGPTLSIDSTTGVPVIATNTVINAETAQPAPLFNIDVTSADGLNMPELHAVTSVAELKYACENKGLFYKLDLDTGVLVPINVCVKKSPRSKVPTLISKSVIDLTNDLETILPATTITRSGCIRLQPRDKNKKTKDQILRGYKQVTVKPVKMFKALYPSLLRSRSKIDQETSDTIPNEGLKKRISKQSLDKIEAKIDLVDSDAPMEEEYLVESSDSDDEFVIGSIRSASNKKHIKTYQIQMRNADKSTPSHKSFHEKILESDNSDSSDDEPLAKKVRRKEESIGTKDSSVADDVGNKVLKPPIETQAQDDLSKTAPNDVPAEPIAKTVARRDVPAEPIAKDVEQVTNDGIDIIPKPTVAFIDDDSGDDTQEDCILGF